MSDFESPPLKIDFSPEAFDHMFIHITSSPPFRLAKLMKMSPQTANSLIFLILFLLDLK